MTAERSALSRKTMSGVLRSIAHPAAARGSAERFKFLEEEEEEEERDHPHGTHIYRGLGGTRRRSSARATNWKSANANAAFVHALEQRHQCANLTVKQ